MATTTTITEPVAIFDAKADKFFCTACTGVIHGLSMLDAVLKDGVAQGYQHKRYTTGLLQTTNRPTMHFCAACNRHIGDAL